MKKNNRAKMAAFVSGIVLIVCSGLAPIYAAENGIESEFLLFPTFQLEKLSNVDPNSGEDDSIAEPGISIFYTARKNNWSILSEVFLNEEEQEIERFLVGWTIKESNIMWVGRYHNPIGYWNINNHHGTYLSTPVHRPAVVEFEDEGGLIPTHVSGFLLQGSYLNSSTELKYNISFGVSPRLSTTGLEAFNTFRVSNPTHNPSFTAHVSYTLDDLGRHELGGFYNFNDIKSDRAAISRVEQQVSGMFYHANLGLYTISASIFSVSNEIYQSTSSSSSSFLNIFALLERQVAQSWTVYLGRDYSHDAYTDPYVIMFPNFVYSKSSIGLRYDLNEKQAITGEVANTKNALGDNVHSTLQWSAVFP